MFRAELRAAELAGHILREPAEIRGPRFDIADDFHEEFEFFGDVHIQPEGHRGVGDGVIAKVGQHGLWIDTEHHAIVGLRPEIIELPLVRFEIRSELSLQIVEYGQVVGSGSQFFDVRRRGKRSRLADRRWSMRH